MAKPTTFEFDGSAGEYIRTALLAGVIVVASLGFATPYAVARRRSWRARHTLIEGRRLVFVGSGRQLLRQWVAWWGLTILTLGVYSFWVVPKMTQWLAENTEFEKVQIAYAGGGVSSGLATLPGPKKPDQPLEITTFSPGTELEISDTSPAVS